MMASSRETDDPLSCVDAAAGVLRYFSLPDRAHCLVVVMTTGSAGRAKKVAELLHGSVRMLMGFCIANAVTMLSACGKEEIVWLWDLFYSRREEKREMLK